MKIIKLSKNVYENSKTYKIVDKTYTEQYIGSTTVGLSTRMARHRAKYWGYKRGEKYHGSCFLLFDKYGLENCKIELIENYPCESKEELRKREGYWIKNEKCVNKLVPGRTQKEWLDLNREKRKQYEKEYCLNHLADKKAYDIEYYKKTRLIRSEQLVCSTCGIAYTRQHQKRHERSQRHIEALETSQ